MQYTATQFVTLQTLQNKPPRIGQWVCLDGDKSLRGQYLGTTAAGTVTIRYQKQGNFQLRDATGNKHLRAFAKTYGAK